MLLSRQWCTFEGDYIVNVDYHGKKKGKFGCKHAANICKYVKHDANIMQMLQIRNLHWYEVGAKLQLPNLQLTSNLHYAN